MTTKYRIVKRVNKDEKKHIDPFRYVIEKKSLMSGWQEVSFHYSEIRALEEMEEIINPKDTPDEVVWEGEV